MSVRSALATVWLIVVAVGGCAAPAGGQIPAEEAPASDQPLDITVDSLDIVHGALRVSATMVDGAADVSVRLGGDCEHREIGGGLSTLSTLVWSLGDDDVADAIGCGLAVRARVRDGARYVNKVAELDLVADVPILEADVLEGEPRLQTVTTSESGVHLVFAPVTRGSRLTTGDSVLEAAPPEPGEDPAEDSAGRFTVPFIDFVRCVLRGRPLYLDGSPFATALSVGGTAVQGELQGSDESQQESDEALEESSMPP